MALVPRVSVHPLRPITEEPPLRQICSSSKSRFHDGECRPKATLHVRVALQHGDHYPYLNPRTPAKLPSKLNFQHQSLPQRFLLNSSEDGKLNPEFVRAILGKMTGEQRAAFMTKDGQLSQDGATKIKEAILAKAFPSSSLLERITEDTDDNVKRISNALLASAPLVAELSEAVASGDAFEADISNEIAEAANKIAASRANRKTFRISSMLSHWLSNPTTTKRSSR